jgi:TonB family protein
VREPPPDRAVVSVERAEAWTGPGGKAPLAKSLPRGTPLQVLRSEGDFFLVAPPSGGDVWVLAGTFERLSDAAARERRQAAVRDLPPQPGLVTESCELYLAPDYGAARREALEEGSRVDVVLAEHDFFGVLLPDRTLAFAPARSVRLLPPPPGTPTPAPVARGGVVPQVEPLFPEAGAVTAPPLPQVVGPPAPIANPADPSASGGLGPLPSLPAGATAPVLVRRVDPVYPEMAKQLRLGGDVTLRLVVEADGTTGQIDVVSGGKAGFGEAAAEAVRKWVYRPARVDGQPVAVWKIVRVRFTMEPERDVPND